MAYNKHQMKNSHIKPIIAAIMLTVASTDAAALTVRQVLSSMPDSILAIFTKNDRLDFIDFIDSNMKAKVNNRLGEPTVMTVLTDDFCHIDMDERSTIEMKILNDSTFCIVNSVKVTTHWDSDIRVYKSDWTELSSTDFFAMPSVEQFIPKPESMTPTQYRNLLNRAETPYYHMSFTAGSTDLTVTYSTSATADSDYDTMLRPYIHPTLTLPLRQ